jgi:hypothetical protein
MTHPKAAARAPSRPAPSQPLAGFGPETEILTADGLIPAAFLEAGERIVTRRGMRVLAAVIRRPWPADMAAVRVLPGWPTCGTGGAALLSPAQRIAIRDQRSGALCGRAVVTRQARQLVDGTHLRWELRRPAEIVQLFLGRPEILHADGLALASADPVPAAGIPGPGATARARRVSDQIAQHVR